MPQFALAERRRKPRYHTDGLLVCVRKKGYLGHLEGLARDFNRHGLSMIIDQPLAKDTTVYISLYCNAVALDNVVGIVHNCVGMADGYRCGIQFRTCSDLQLDQAQTEHELAIIEACFQTMGRLSPS